MALKPGEIRVEELWELFRVFHSRPRGFKERILRFQKSVYEDFWALKGVSFHLEPGETLAVIGANGSGKSTLLKCLTRILTPDRGEVEVGGKVATLLELGAGFHGDLTGRENIYLNGSILGMRKKDLDRAFDQIVAYSGVGEFIDNPVRNYSSGMFVRLGFSIAVNVDPDVLLIDEILAVGDSEFQTKCFEKMHEFKRGGKTLVLVTHDVNAAVSLCDRAILLDRGNLIADGPTSEIGTLYLERVLAGKSSRSTGTLPVERSKRRGTGKAQVIAADLLDGSDQPTDTLSTRSKATFRQRIQFVEEVEDPVFGYVLRADNGVNLAGSNSLLRRVRTGKYYPGDVVEVRFTQQMNLLPGKYVFSALVATRDGSQWYDWWDDCLPFHVLGNEGDTGFVDLDSDMHFEKVSPAADTGSPVLPDTP